MEDVEVIVDPLRTGEPRIICLMLWVLFLITITR